MEWFYAYNGQQAGPVTEADLGELARTGVVTPETLVWHAGMGDWQPYSSAARPTPSSTQTATQTEDLRFCNSCGNRFPVSELAMFGESAVCANCKPAYVQRLRQGMTSTAAPVFEYGGFWVRVVAVLIDSVILSVIRYAITIPMGLEGFMQPMRPGVFLGFFGMAAAISQAIQIAYYVYFWTQQGATPGKMAMGLKVVQPDGSLITVPQAFGRYFANLLDMMTLGIGYMMAGWDSEKRALHDRICGTRVIRVR